MIYYGTLQVILRPDKYNNNINSESNELDYNFGKRKFSNRNIDPYPAHNGEQT